jgi:hypothetical protein
LRLAACVFTALALTAAASAQEPIAGPVRAVIERSRAPTVDHSLVTTTRATVYGATSLHTTAEFHRGSMHRVETAENRVIANCATGERIVYYMLENRIERSRRDDGGACGIGNPEPVLSSRMLPRVTGPWGPADVIELTGADFVRRYAVSEGGVLLSSDYVPRRSDVGLAIETVRVQVTRGTPDAAMFEESSLRRAFARPIAQSATPSP